MLLKRYIAMVLASIALLFYPVAAITETPVSADFLRLSDDREGKINIVVVPEKNVFDQRKRYKHITDYLADTLGKKVNLEILPDYDSICQAFVEGKADAGFFGSFSYVLTKHHVDIEPIARPVLSDGSSTYRGYIFARKDSGIASVEDMKGKRLVLVDKATTAGYIFPKFFFNNYHIPRMEEYFSRVVFTGSHDSAAWSVYIGENDVGAAKNHIFDELSEEHPDFRDQMEILARSSEVPSNGLAVRSDLDPNIKDRLRFVLTYMEKSEDGRRILEKFGAKQFIVTVDRDYNELKNMIREMAPDLNEYPCKGK